jgi:uncharacterized membrane protein
MSGWKGPLLAMLAAAGVSAVAGIIATPRVIMDIAVDRMAKRTGINRFIHAPLTTPETQTIVRPSPDLAYSACPFDLAKGPLQIDVVPVAGRYSSLSIFDARTDVIFVRNDMQAGGKPYRVTLALPHHDVRAGPEVVRTDYARGIALIRLLLADPAELPKVERDRQSSTCRIIGAASAN